VVSVDRFRLIDLLGSDSAPEALAAANDLRAGANFTLHDSESHTAEHFPEIYRRRAEWLRYIGIDARGIDRAVERFAAEDELGGYAYVHGPDRYYMVFFAVRAERVIACISMPGSAP
jgi:hypothetical protein